MKVSDLKEKCVSCEMISRNSIGDCHSKLGVNYLSIFELLNMIQSSNGVIYVDSHGDIHNESFPLSKIFEGGSLFIFTYHTPPSTDSESYFVLVETFQEARQLFLKSAKGTAFIVDYQAIFTVPNYKSRHPYQRDSKLPLKYVNFELVGVNNIAVRWSLPLDFTSQIVPISFMIIHSIINPIIIDGTGFHFNPEILNIIDDDDYKDKGVYIIALSDIRTGSGGVLCAITDNINRFVDCLKEDWQFVFYYWKINIIDVSNIRRI